MLISKNPYTGEEFANLEEASQNSIDKVLKTGVERFRSWKKTSFRNRARCINKLAEVLKEKSREYAELITREMGKPIHQSESEIEKSIAICDYFAENAETQLATEEVETEADKSYISYSPLGVILEIMPWNYPFFLPLRSAVPALMAGNTVVLKHASNVMQSALKLEQAFKEAGFPEGVFPVYQ